MGARSRILEGHSLARGLAEFPRVFPGLFRATVAAGEQSGHLAPVLERLADYTEARQQTRQKIGLALVYPVLLSVAALGAVIGLLAYVVPEVIKVFENIGQQLPAITRGLIAVSEFLQAWGLVLLASIVLLTVGAAWPLRHPGPRRAWHRTLLNPPLVGRLARGLNAALDETGYFLPMTVRLIASGEASGKLDEMLERAAVNHER